MQIYASERCTQTMKNPGRIQDFFKEKQWSCKEVQQTAVRGRERGDINPPMGARRRGGAAQKDSAQGQKRPLHRDKSSKKAPA